MILELCRSKTCMVFALEYDLRIMQKQKCTVAAKDDLLISTTQYILAENIKER